jgi:hypothetical protein
MEWLQPFAIVRVRQLLQDASEYDGWGLNKRLPRVGDSGTVLDILAAPRYPTRFVVECVQSGGRTLWLADFLAEELEPA